MTDELPRDLGHPPRPASEGARMLAGVIVGAALLAVTIGLLLYGLIVIG